VEMYDRDGWMDTRIGVWRCGCDWLHSLLHEGAPGW